jgi:hypothetical protein
MVASALISKSSQGDCGRAIVRRLSRGVNDEARASRADELGDCVAVADVDRVMVNAGVEAAHHRLSLLTPLSGRWLESNWRSQSPIITIPSTSSRHRLREEVP